MKALKKLDLSDNAIRIIPPEIGKLQALTSINLKDNYLKDLPDEIGELKELLYLNIEKNMIPPERIREIKKLLPNCQIDW